MSVILGVFTISRQDIIDVSKAIARCIPDDFLNDPRKPVRIAVNGGYQSGKKIVADYGRNAFLGIADEVFHNSEKCEKPQFVKLCRAFNCTARLRCYGAPEYDEYVDLVSAGTQRSVSFINMAWLGGYSEAIPKNLSDKKKISSHLAQRKYGGAVFIHNTVAFIAKPDIEIRIEDEAFTTNINGQNYHCCDVRSAIDDASDLRANSAEREWFRYIQVTINNKNLIKDGGIVAMLRDEFGCVAPHEMPASVFTDFAGECGALNKGTFPLRKTHLNMLKAC